MLDIIIGIFLCFVAFYGPVIYIWCIKPHKSLKEGLRDWLDDSADDI